MELTPTEVKYATAIAQDMDLMIRAREFAHMEDTAYPSMQVLEAIQQNYQGGVTQFYLHNHF